MDRGPRFVTVTELRGGGPGAGDDGRCSWCGRRLPDPAGTGRPRRYCRRSCRQRAFEARRRLDEMSWGEDRLRDLLGRLDDQYVVLASVRDVVDEMERDVEDGRDWDTDTRDELVRRLRALLLSDEA